MAGPWEQFAEDEGPWSKFGSTPGGAAVGNPNIQTQGRKAVRPDVGLGSPIGAIAGAGTLGAVGGLIGGDILQGVGRVAGAFPQGRALGPILENTGRLISANRPAATMGGLISGVAGESAGQTVEAVGGPQWLAEGARFGVGALTPELASGAKFVLKKYVIMPSLSITSKAKKEAAKAILAKLEGGELKTLSEKEAAYLNQLRDELRGGPKSDADLEAVGVAMGREASRREGQALAVTQSAERTATTVNPLTGRPARELADVGEELGGEINKRMGGMIAARDSSYKANQQARDNVVKVKQSAGQFVNKTPEYIDLVASLKAELQPGKRSESVQAGIKKILADIESFGTTPAQSRLSGSGDFLETTPATAGPMQFQALDDVRRKLGEAYRGKPAEGYDAIGESMAKDLYAKVSNIQENFAGPAQRKLLDDYAVRTEGLEVFHSMRGRKATAVDRYDPSQFSTDPSSLPTTYFKTRASVKALEELTGSKALVNKAAMDYANRELQGLQGPQVRAWMQKNSEWLGETPVVRQLVDRYATRLEGVERQSANAKEFAEAAMKDANILRGKALPAQRAIDLIKSGSPELWEKAGPAIANSPQAKTSVLNSARQVLADEATSKGVIDFYSRNLRPFLERANVTNKAELDFLAQKLAHIKELKVPEEQKLGLARRLVLNGFNSWSASVGARGADWAREKVVPD